MTFSQTGYSHPSGDQTSKLCFLEVCNLWRDQDCYFSFGGGKEERCQCPLWAQWFNFELPAGIVRCCVVLPRHFSGVVSGKGRCFQRFAARLSRDFHWFHVGIPWMVAQIWAYVSIGFGPGYAVLRKKGGGFLSGSNSFLWRTDSDDTSSGPAGEGTESTVVGGSLSQGS